MSRYHPLLVALHWLLAALILAMLAIGFFWLRAMPAADPAKIAILQIHMVAGVTILALMIVRFVVRMQTSRPPPTTGSRFVDRVARAGHYGFYVIVVLLAATGYATALRAGLPAIVFGRSGAPLPERFTVYPSFIGHALLAELLVLFILIHLLAALYHQFGRRDGSFRRMWFGPETPESPGETNPDA
jgi:cytochrome b561